MEWIGSRSPEATKGLGSSRHATQLKWDWDNSKRVPRNTRNEGQICPSQAPSDAAKNHKAWRATTHEQKAGTLGNLWRRTIRRSSWKNLQPGRDGFGSLGKNNKKKGQPKVESKWNGKSTLQGHPEMESQLSKDTLKWKVSKWLLGKQHQKEENYEK